MKKIIFGSLSVLVLLTACGSSKDDKMTFDDAKLEFKDSGKYDLKEYIVPKEDQISNYENNEFTDLSGKRKYKNEADENSPYFNAVSFDVNGSVVKESEDGNLQTTYRILSNKIESVDTDNSKEIFVRYADVGDYILKFKELDDDLGDSELVCKLSNHYDKNMVNNKEYSDIIEISCTINTIDSKTVGGSKIEVVGGGSIKKLFAKDKGLISDIIDFCKTTKTDSKDTNRVCVKQTQEIATIN